MHFPTDVKSQLGYVNKKYLDATNPQIKQGVKEKYTELDVLKRNGNEINYFIFIYGKDISSLRENRANLISDFNDNNSIKEISKEKKIEVFYKYNNPVELIN